MKRFYGSAVFEGEEVTDAAFTQLLDIRSEEVRRIEAYEYEFKLQYEEAVRWRHEELAIIESNASRQINQQYAQINRAYYTIAQINRELQFTITAIRANFFLLLNLRSSRAEQDAIAAAEAVASSAIHEQYRIIHYSHSAIAQIQSERINLIRIVERDFEIEINTRRARMEKDIAWAHSDATERINAIIARHYKEPVHMLRCAKGPCEFCRAKYGTTGTHAQLEKIKCIPPFHDDCRCWLEKVGYTVMLR